MKNKTMIRDCFIVFIGLFLCMFSNAQVDRGTVVLTNPQGQIYVSWKQLRTDARDVGFNVYRQNTPQSEPVKINTTPIAETTGFLDTSFSGNRDSARWFVKPIENGVEGKASIAVKLRANNQQPYFEFEMHQEADFQWSGIADLDGDGLNDYVIHLPKNYIDPFCSNWNRSGNRSYKLHAYDHYGNFMWEYDRGFSIEMGIWYAPFVVYDFNKDGIAEVALKAGDGDPRDENGRVFTGKEYLRILDGRTGKEISEADWIPREGFSSEGCESGSIAGYNRASRNLMTIAYLDGETPHIITARGTYGRMFAEAFKLEGTALQKVWSWNNLHLFDDKHWRGQGGHFIHGADIDLDGNDEVVLGLIAIGEDGKEMWTAGQGHVDHNYIGDIDPTRPGLEMYYGLELHGDRRRGMGLIDAATGEYIWYEDIRNAHLHREGMVGDIDPDSPGWESYSRDNRWTNDTSDDVDYFTAANGSQLQLQVDFGTAPKPVFWDNDVQKELVVNKEINNFKSGQLQKIMDFPGRIVAIADFLGDWREEVVVAHENKIRIYCNNVPSDKRFVSLMEDRLYRNDVASQTMGYFQSPMSSYDITENRPMVIPPVDPYVDCKGIVGGSAYVDDCGVCVVSQDSCSYEDEIFEEDIELEIVNEEVVWEYEQVFDISSHHTVKIEAEIEGSTSGTMESSDYFRIYYILDGREKAMVELIDGFDRYTAVKTGVKGNNLKIVVKAKTDADNEKYTLYKLKITGADIGDPNAPDCNGVPGGTAYLDNCEVCVGGNTNVEPCVQDCKGNWGGMAVLDDCGNCIVVEEGEEPCVDDCNGILGGTAFIDVCGVCVGGDTGLEKCDQGVVFNEPNGGWDYIYKGDQGATGTNEALDGQWTHKHTGDYVPDAWDSSAPGDGKGGIAIHQTEDATFMRMQDVGYPGSGQNNKKINLIHEFPQDGMLDTGITFAFRVRLANKEQGFPLDDYREARDWKNDRISGAWPIQGKGVDLRGGRGMFTLSQTSPLNSDKIEMIGFSFLDQVVNDDIHLRGLVMNSYVQDQILPQEQSLINVPPVGNDSYKKLNTIDVENATVWHEYWIQIQEGEANGTHKIKVWKDGNVQQDFDFFTTSAEYENQGRASKAHLLMGTGLSNGHASAYDIDYVAYKIGLHTPLDCNGVAGGTAYLDACVKCVGGNTGQQSSDECENLGVNTEDQEILSVKIYPNPTKSVLHIRDGQINSYVTLYDVTGRKMMTKLITSEEELLNLSELESGMYLVKIGNKTMIPIIKK